MTDHDERTFEPYPTIAQQEVSLRGDLAPGMYSLQIDGTARTQKFVKR